MLCVPILACTPLLVACGTFDAVPKGATSLFQAFQPTSPEVAAELALDQYDADKRYRGIRILSNASYGGGDTHIQLYVDALDDEDATVRAAAVGAIARHGQPEHVPRLVARLYDANALVRMEAARALQRLHNPVAVDPLISRLDPEREDEPRVRAAAANALGQYAQNRVVQALISALDDPSLSVNHNTRRSLRILTGQDFALDTRAWLRWFDATGDPFAARAAYEYPAYQRDREWFEWLPLVPEPPVETPSNPVGMRPTIEG